MTVLMFQERFAPLVQAGAKIQTVRPVRKRTIRPGDKLSLRRWEGKAYRSKQVEICSAIAIGTFRITITRDGVYSGQERFERPDVFAQRDGFLSYSELLSWFERTHGLPFDGELILWEPIK